MNNYGFSWTKKKIDCFIFNLLLLIKFHRRFAYFGLVFSTLSNIKNTYHFIVLQWFVLWKTGNFYEIYLLAFKWSRCFLMLQHPNNFLGKSNKIPDAVLFFIESKWYWISFKLVKKYRMNRKLMENFTASQTRKSPRKTV